MSLGPGRNGKGPRRKAVAFLEVFAEVSVITLLG